MNYHGQLYFEDDDIINVVSFIVREEKKSLAFDVIANWGGQGKWRRSGIANLKDGVFESETENSRQEETGQQGIPCKLRFIIENESNDFLTISGSWSEEGDEYEFEGDLEPKC